VFPVRYGLYLCVPYGSHNKQRLFPQTALTVWDLKRIRNVFPARYELNLYLLFVFRMIFLGMRTRKIAALVARTHYPEIKS
jgi:hypothetical protein